MKQEWWLTQNTDREPWVGEKVTGGSQDQAEWIGQQIYQAARQLRLPVNAATVLVYSSSVGKPLAEALTSQGLPAKFMSSSSFDLEEPCIKVTTLHAAKGLEFPTTCKLKRGPRPCPGGRLAS